MRTFEPYLALHASAGSGKTYALSVRYISLLFLGASPSKILTLTFTNKAASEMKSRIYDTIKNLESKSELDAICEQVGMSKEEVLSKKEEVLEKFLKEDLLISTIDSFFASILRKFALNAGFMPDFKIETALKQSDFLEKFLRMSLQEKKYESLLKFSINEEKKLSDIFTLLESFYNKEGEFDSSIFARANYINPSRVLELSKELKEAFEKAGASATAINSFENEDIPRLLGRSFLKYEDLSESRTYKKYVNQEIEELYDALKRELLLFINAREKYILGELGDLYKLYKNTLRALNKELSTLSFSDVSSAIYTLLQDEISKEFLYFRLDSKIEHMLLDEFQDTNVLQYKILEPLMEEIISGVGVREFKSLFFVGDIKQSIYRFRGGSKELFEHTVKHFGVKRDFLDTNYRSNKHIVEFVNAIFSKKIKNYEMQKVNSKEEGFVQVLVCDSLEEEVIKSVVFLLEKGVTCKDIAILVHQNKDAKIFKELLLEKIERIKVQTEASIKLIDMPLISAILDFVKYLYFKDELYVQNFLVAIGRDWREKIDISWANLDKAPFVLLKEIIKRYEIFANDLDIIKLLEIAYRYDDIESFIFESEFFSEDAKSEDNDGLKILTIHKSKGLEFEHVIVVDRLSAPRGGGGTLMYEYDDIKLSAIYQRVEKREFIDATYKNAKEKEETLAYEDKLNMQYVAFTRAESSLIVCKKENSSAFDMLELEELVLGEVRAKNEVLHEDTKLIKMQRNFKAYGAQEQQKVQEDEEYKEFDFFAVEYGLALHYCLEMLYRFDKNSLENAYEAMFNRYSLSLSVQSLESIKKRIERLCEDEKFLSLVDGAKVYKEQPIIYNQERKQIDLLLVHANRVIIVDYKSSQSLQDSHVKQVLLYKKAIEEIYDLPVSAYVCYLKEEAVELISL
jgi:ATP-dependent exoDNAse (exonuclease V) beta subunit